MKTICFKIQKGGCGCTSIGVSTAVQLALNGKSVLLIDADPQGNATTWLNFDTIEFELADILTKKIPAEKSIKETAVKNLYVIPTAGIGGELDTIKESVFNNEPFLISDICESLQNRFDYCIIDMCPSFGSLERSCYMASDEIIPVLLLDNFSFDGIQIFNSHITDLKKHWRINGKMDLKKLVLNKSNKTESVTKIMLQSYKEQFADLEIFIIPQEPNLKKAQLTNCFLQDLKDTKKETLQEIERLAASIK